MKLIILLIILNITTVFANSNAQSITIEAKNITLVNTMHAIQKQSGYAFFLKGKQLANIRQDISISKLSLSKAMAEILKDVSAEWELENGTIVIRAVDQKKKETFKPLPSTPGVYEIQRTITGKVTDEEGNVLEGVSVMVKDSKNGTVTDSKGQFSININDNEKILVFSMIGYASFEKEVGTKSSYNIILKKKEKDLGEVVITTGLFARPTENFTGVATAVSGDQLRKVNSLNVFDALKVFDPAIRIPDNIDFGSDPNRMPKISIRGTNNFPGQGGATEVNLSGADFMAAYQSNPSMPLFMLDGFEVSLQKIYDLDINRIDKITILKDAVATSAYGSRAANGVIVVETKQPKMGKLTVNYSTTLQITAPDLTSYNLLNAADKLELEKVGGLYKTNRPENQLILDQRYSNRRAAVESGVNTYWLSQPLQTGIGNKQSLYVEGGDAYVRYGASLGYFNNKGVMKGSDRESIEGGMFLSYRKNSFLVRNQLNISSNRSDNSPYGSFGSYTRMNPYWYPYDEKGNVRKILETIAGTGVGGSSVIANPLYNALVGTQSYGKYSGINNNTFFEWRFLNGFKLTAKFGLSSQKDESSNFLPADHTSFSNITDYNSEAYATRGSFDRSNSSFFSYDGSLVGDYNKTLGKSLIFATLGVSAAEQQSRSTGISVRGFPNNRLDELFYGNGYLKNSRPSGQNNISRRFSSFANFNYTYDRRFLFDLALNVDGSTQFGELNRFAPFWAVGAGWNLHEEGFMQDYTSVINRLKIRAGLGTTGSQQFPPYMAITTYVYNTNQDYLGMYGTNVLGYGNHNLKWQETFKYNLGADMSFLQDRFQLRLDAYYEMTNNLLLDINTPPSLGVYSYKENMGKLANKGIEGNLNVFIFKPSQKRFSWSVFVNAIHNKNEIKEISNALKKMNEANDNNNQTRPHQRYEEGESVNAIWAVRSAGIDPSTGKELFYDREGNLTYVWSAKDKVIVGDGIPKFSGNTGTNITYKGFQFGAYFSYQLGAKQYNQTLADYVENADISNNVDERVFIDRWKKPGDITFFKGLTDVKGTTVTSITNATSRFMQKNNFLNFTSISIGYMIPDKIFGNLGLKNSRISLQGNNILQLSTIQVERGLSYPFARNFTINFNTSF
ncbi:MAG: SusC/RagA family TonB-linked outer membrane protein [Chitinophagaceae bacterium]|nr:MAG: SusC/RagA family TonB-linked outer membrane protein [Chitinophagaceae bacterium]